MKNVKSTAKYKGYDKTHVTFWYEDHRTEKKVIEKQLVYRFIFNLLQHISPKHFRMVGLLGYTVDEVSKMRAKQ
ncbi:transposase [Solibacillus sp.]|uniref:transposase n=1 Tax=Solibacillus sp. TaxID=1909654 RepID=UPI003314E541